MIPQIQKGFYVIRIPKMNLKIPIKITTSINNRNNLQLNGYYQEFIPL